MVLEQRKLHLIGVNIRKCFLFRFYTWLDFYGYLWQIHINYCL